MRTLALVGSLVFTQISCLGEDWPQYLGRNGDLTSPETVRTNWTELAPREVWRKPIGPGFSSVVVSGGRVFTQVRKTLNGADREFCVALDVETGAQLWERDVDVADYSNLSGYPEQMDGPRSTPTVEGDRLYVATSHLKLYCLDVTTGDVLWQRDFRSELGSPMIPWENAASPLVVGDLIFVNANATPKSLLALRKSDGQTAWSGPADGMTHATPVQARIGGTDQIVFLTRRGLIGVLPGSGEVLWRLEFTPSSTSTAASPGVTGDYVYASAAYGSGTWIGHVEKAGEEFAAAQVGRQQGTAYQAHWSTPVAHEGFLYCVPAPSSSQGRLTCLDVASGTNRWAQSNVGTGSMGYGSVIKAANVLIALTEAGELVLVQPDPTAYREVARWKVLTLYCWNHVTLANGRLYARSTSLKPEIVALDVGDALAPLPAVGLTAERLPDAKSSFRLTLRATGAGSLDSNQLNRLEVRTSPNVTAPSASWSVLTPAFAPVNSDWVADVLLGVEPSLFFKIQEKSSP